MKNMAVKYAEDFIKEDLKKFGYDGVYGITPLTEDEVQIFSDIFQIIKCRADKNSWFHICNPLYQTIFDIIIQ